MFTYARPMMPPPTTTTSKSRCCARGAVTNGEAGAGEKAPAVMPPFGTAVGVEAADEKKGMDSADAEPCGAKNREAPAAAATPTLRRTARRRECAMSTKRYGRGGADPIVQGEQGHRARR